MPETARVLSFPRRWEIVLSPEEAADAARSFLEKRPDERSAEETDRFLSDTDVLSSICKLLRKLVNSNPKAVAEQAPSIHAWLTSRNGNCGLFDEGSYFLGETALLTAGAFRFLGDREEAESWLLRAEAGFRHTVNPGPVLAQVAYHRLALQYARGKYKDVLDIIPSALKSFETFGMRAEAAKTRFLEALTLKQCARNSEAFERFRALAGLIDEREEPGLLGQTFVEIAAMNALEGCFEGAVENYRRAMPLLVAENRLFAVADLKMTVGETLRNQGALPSAVEAFREAVSAYAELEMVANVAYARVILAETLIALDRHREAEWEILAALPTIEDQKMVPEGFAAVALLRESVSRRQADPNALRELREHLKANS